MESKRISPANVFAKDCIVSALLKLIYHKPLSTITISELCQKAGVSRMTFYRNYTSIEDIFTVRLSEIFEEYRQDSHYRTGNGIFYDESHMIHYFSSLYKYREFLNGLIYCGFGSRFLDMLDHYILEEWMHTADPYTLTAFSGSLYNLFRLWASTGYAEATETMAGKLKDIFQDCEMALS